jgi:RNA polymerase sigma-70 factor (ECF subfamily)
MQTRPPSCRETLALLPVTSVSPGTDGWHGALCGPALETSSSERALNQLIRSHASSVGIFLQRLGVPSADVDDVKQRVWLTALRWSARLQPGRERAFLFAVARREAGHTRRTSLRRAEVDAVALDALPNDAPPADEIVARAERVRLALAVLAAMDEEQRELFVTLESGAATAGDVARGLGIPLGTAKSRWRRAREECRRIVRRACTG